MRARRALESALSASALGAGVGGLTLLLEALFSAPAFTWTAMAAYALVGGLIGAGSQLLGELRSSGSGRVGALGAIAAFGLLHLVYLANVKLLPSEHYLSGKSLMFDLLTLAAIVLPALLLGPVLGARLTPAWVGRAGEGLGLVFLACCVFLLASAWPRSKPSVKRSGQGPNLVLIVVDSLRQDRLSVQGTARAVAPSLARASAGGRVFSRAFAASSWTVPSVGRLLGQGESESSGDALERLRARGYLTACFSDNPHLSEGASLLSGFDRVERSVDAWHSIFDGTVLGQVAERLDPGSDADLVTKALEWAQAQAGPFLLYVQLMDSHTPYRFPPLDGRRRKGRRIEFPRPDMPMTAEEAEDVVARYDGGVRSADAQVGRLLDVAGGWGRPFVAVITSDHGESLGEHGRWFHGQSLAPELLAIPLVVVGQGVVPGLVEGPVGHDAVMPTLLAAAGVDCSGCAGVDLRTQEGSGLVDGGLPPRLVYRIAGRYKVVLDLETGRRELFDRYSDPGERWDLAPERPEIAARLSAGLTARPPSPRTTAESIERLRSLGYAAQ